MAYAKMEKSMGQLYPEKERKSDKAPAFKGPFKITKAQARALVRHFENGAEEVTGRLAAWKNSGQQGPYIGLELEVPEYQDQGAPQRQRPAPAPEPVLEEDPFDDDIPF